jgi:archaellin
VKGYNTAGVLTGDDIINICFASVQPIYENEPITIIITPKYGGPTQFTADTPLTMTTGHITFFP